MTIEADSLRIDGWYVMTCHSETERSYSLFYPYPRDDKLDGARTLALAVRVGNGPWQSTSWQEMPKGRGARWRIPVVPDSTVTVRTTYRQARCADYARYIVTTTGSWGAPLQKAEFEIHLPPGVKNPSFSYPFIQGQDGIWRYAKIDFNPEVDILVEWGGSGGPSANK